MRIVHVVENLERGGLERVVIDLASAQRSAGHDCLVACLFEEGVLGPELRAAGVPLVACGKRGGIDLRALRRLRAAIRGHRADVVHTHNAMAHYYAALATRGAGLQRLVNSRHSMSSRAGEARGEWLYRRAMRVTDYAVAVCDAARARLAHEGVRPRRGLVSIPNGIHTGQFTAGSDHARAALAQALGFAPGTRLVGTVGRLTPVKDQTTLIHAFASFARDMPDTALVLVGDGPLRERLDAEAAASGVGERIRLLGDRNDVRALLPGLSVFALSSTSEGYSMALLEACASALPIVATDVGGNGEIVRDRLNGRLVPARDPAVLGSALLELLRLPPPALAALGDAGREWVLAEGSFARMAERYDALYGDAARAGERAPIAAA